MLAEASQWTIGARTCRQVWLECDSRENLVTYRQELPLKLRTGQPSKLAPLTLSIDGLSWAWKTIPVGPVSANCHNSWYFQGTFSLIIEAYHENQYGEIIAGELTSNYCFLKIWSIFNSRAITGWIYFIFRLLVPLQDPFLSCNH